MIPQQIKHSIGYGVSMRTIQLGRLRERFFIVRMLDNEPLQLLGISRQDEVLAGVTCDGARD
jgi:hypothetical protein